MAPDKRWPNERLTACDMGLTLLYTNLTRLVAVLRSPAVPRLLLFLPPALFALPAIAAEPGDLEFVEKRVRPIFAQYCHECHGPAKQTSGLRLDTAAGLKKGGDNGPVIVPQKPDDSLLIRAIRRNGDL